MAELHVKYTAPPKSALLPLNFTKELSIIANTDFFLIYKAHPNIATLLLNCIEEVPLNTTLELL